MGSSSTIRSPIRNRWFRLARRANLATAIVLACLNVAMLNLLAARYPARFRWNGSSDAPLSARTHGLLDSIAEDVRIVALVRPSNDTYRPVKALLKEYAVAPNVSFEMVDPDRNLARAEQAVRQYRLDGNECVVFEIGGRHKAVPVDDLIEYGYPNDDKGRRFFRGELLFSSAIQSLSQSSRPTVHFIQGHGERSPTDFDRRNGFSRIAARLRDDNVDVDVLNLGDAKTVPNHCATMVIAGPTREFAPFELSLIRDYLDRKGRLLLLLDARTQTGLEPLLQTWGIQISDDIVVDPAQTLGGRDIHVDAYADHPITAPLQGITSVFSLPRAILVPPPESGGDKPVVHELVASSASGWAEFNPDDPSPRYDEQVDVPGPVPIAVAVERGPIPGVRVQIRPTRLIVFGDSAFVSNGGLMGANADLFLNSVSWLLGHEDGLAIAPRTIEELRLPLNARQLRRLFFLATLLLPCLVVAAGLAVAGWRRSS